MRSNYFYPAFSRLFYCFLCILFTFNNVLAQDAVIRQEQKIIKTYPFGDPSPVPALAQDKEDIYPYFQFQRYSQTGKSQKWKVVTLENKYIKVFILPEVGGKIWGAVEKSTGKEFIYKNEILKFRNIALRGPWTSGGIEFNIGARGHSPMTTTPVNYMLRENEDGSVSCIVGAIDLSSRTRWRVTITLPKDKAYIETKTLWYNPTFLNQSYFAWMTTAIKATNDLQFFFPGDYYIDHSGNVHSWPVDNKGRNLSYYKKNDFGPNKSYHVLGEKTEYFGAYWHDEDFGFGHWSLYHDMPGKKIWIWSLARSGAIWEDLLTDTDGQYVEVQSGRFLNQANLRSAQTPFDQTAFPPSSTEQWRELWFPVKGTGGMVAASPHAVLNIDQGEQKATLKLMALQSVRDELKIFVGDKLIEEQSVSLEPMEVHYTTVDLSDENLSTLKVILGNRKLVYNGRTDNNLNRPLKSNLKKKRNLTADQLYRKARNQANYRRFDRALQTYYASLEKDPSHARAYVGLAELYYRRGECQEAIQQAEQALSIDAYNAGANYIYGLAKLKIGNTTQALSALGLATRSVKYRSAAYTVMAQIYLASQNFDRAIIYADRALNFNGNNINALKILAIGYREKGKKNRAHSILNKIQKIDPLNHFARFEQYLLNQDSAQIDQFNALIRNELPQEIYLELAVFYANSGSNAEAVEVLKQAPAHPVVYYWLAYLQRKKSEQESNCYLKRAALISSSLIYPFRLETIPVLKWALQHNDSWKNTYYLGLIYWHIGQKQKAEKLFAGLKEKPDYAPFYLSRGKLRQELNISNDLVLRDYQKANHLDSNEWRTWHALTNHYFKTGKHAQALQNAEHAYKKFPDRDFIEMDYAKSLLFNRKYKECISLLEQMHILPFEGAYEGHQIFEKANLFFTIEKIKKDQFEKAFHYLKNSKRWPEDLGVGKPYNPDVRLQNYLKASVYQELGKEKQAKSLFSEIYEYTQKHPSGWGADHYMGILASRKLGNHKEAEKLLNEWQGTQPQNSLIKWAEAHFKGYVKRARQIEQQIGKDNPDRVMSFLLLTEAISTTEPY